MQKSENPEIKDDQIETQTADTIKEKGSKTPRKRGAMSKILILLIVFFTCFGVSAVASAVLWYGGIVQTQVCDLVKSDSSIGKQFDCNDVESEDFVIEEKRESNPVVTDLEQVVTKVVEESSGAVVGIGVKGNNVNQDKIVGSGFVASSNGLVVTNNHVVSGGTVDDFFVLIGTAEEPIAVKEIIQDEVNDIALLKVDASNLQALPLGDSETIKVGQTAIAIGNPLGDLSNTVTVGTISALNREVEVSDDSFNFSSKTHFDVIQTDAAINPGNSGGPLINSNGEVVGVNFATISGADNLSFALPINIVKQRINELNEFGAFRMPFLGVEYQRRLVFYENEGIVGAVVGRVVPESPAAKAGIKTNDIIVQFDGESLEDTSLLNLIQRTEIGEEVEVVIIRDGKSQTVNVTIADRNELE